MLQEFFSKNEHHIRNELDILSRYKPVKKDVLIIVHNGLEWIKRCLDSIRKNTEEYTIWIWDNASDKNTLEYLKQQSDVNLVLSEENLGFGFACNRLAELSSEEYLIFLNSDCEVMKNWDKILIAHLQQNMSHQTGFSGGFLNSEMRGYKIGHGFDCHYISGHCFAIARDFYKKFGLFDDVNIKFAYGEDSDFSLRLKESGYKYYAFYLNHVLHHGNKTTIEVIKNKDCREIFEKNHEYLKIRHAKFIRDNNL